MLHRYTLHPGPIRSKSDGQHHHVGAADLTKLYQVPFAECRVYQDRAVLQRVWDQDADVIDLAPRYRGDYEEHLAKELERVDIERQRLEADWQAIQKKLADARDARRKPCGRLRYMKGQLYVRRFNRSTDKSTDYRTRLRMAIFSTDENSECYVLLQRGFPKSILAAGPNKRDLMLSVGGVESPADFRARARMWGESFK